MRYPTNELYGNSEPICPYCKTKISVDDWNPEDHSEEQMECPDCEKKFMVQTHIDVNHSTVGDCALNGELPHEFVKGWSESSPFTCRKCKGELYDWDLPGGKYPKLKEGEYKIVGKEDGIPF